MKKFVLSALALTMLAGCGVGGVGPMTANKSSAIGALSKESFAKLVDSTRAFVKVKFDEADLDKSGFLSKDEAMPVGTAYVLGQSRLGAFEVLDADKDGQLAFGEIATDVVVKDIAQNLHVQLVNLFVGLDRDSDMVLKGDEIPPAYDLNGNGQVPFGEYEEAYVTFSMAGTAGQVRYLIALYDTNRDGLLTLTDLRKAPLSEPVGGWAAGQKDAQLREFFKQADTNHDNRLSFDELKAVLPGPLALPAAK
ncbi:EF-hand domain-containing protein [bacterium]|nr:EF-hand domain-containing protein [bacterium]